MRCARNRKHAQKVTSDHNIWQIIAKITTVCLVCWIDFCRFRCNIFGILLWFLTYKNMESFIFVILYMFYHSTAWETDTL